jgi:O-antigen ligase
VFYNLRPNHREIKTFLAVLTALSSVIGWLSFARYFVVGWTRDIIGWSSNPAAFFFGLLVPVAMICLLDSRRNLERVFWWCVILGIFAGIFVTQSRAIYLSVFIGIMLLSIKDKRVLRVLAPILLGMFLVAPVLLIYRMAMMFGVTDDVDWSSVGRVQIWLNSMTLIPKYFLTGMGIDSFRTIYSANFPMVFIPAEHPHNYYLKLLFEYGIFGVISFLWLVGGIMKKALNHIYFNRESSFSHEHSRILTALTTGVLTILIASMVDAPFHHPRLIILFWLFLSFIAVLTNPPDDNRAEV